MSDNVRTPESPCSQSGHSAPVRRRRSLYGLMYDVRIPHGTITPSQGLGRGALTLGTTCVIRHPPHTTPSSSSLLLLLLLLLRAPEQRIRRADHLHHVLLCHVRVDLSGRRLGMSQQLLDVALLRSTLNEVGRERVPQYVWSDVPPEPVNDNGTLYGIN